VRSNNDSFVRKSIFRYEANDELLSDGNVIVSGKKPEEQSFFRVIFINWFPNVTAYRRMDFSSMRQMQAVG